MRTATKHFILHSTMENIGKNTNFNVKMEITIQGNMNDPKCVKLFNEFKNTMLQTLLA